MAHIQYAGMRSPLPIPAIAAVSGGNLTGSGTLAIALQGRNRAGWNLPTTLQTIGYTAGQRIQIDLTAPEVGEDIHRLVVSIATTPGDITTIRQVAVYEALAPDQVSMATFPATLFLSEPEHLIVGASQDRANFAALPTGANLINGMIRRVINMGDHAPALEGESRILEYRAASTATVDSVTVFPAATGRWHAIAGFSTYVPDTLGPGGCDEAIAQVNPATVIRPPDYTPDGSAGTPVRLWFYGSLNTSGPITAQGTRIAARFFLNGVDQSQLFDGLMRLTFEGYASRLTGLLDTDGMTTDVEVAYQFGKAGGLLLEKDLPPGVAAAIKVAPAFTPSEVFVGEGEEVTVSLRAFRAVGDVNPLSAFFRNAIAPVANQLRVVPSGTTVRVLDGSAAIGTLVFPVIGSQILTDLLDDTPDQYCHIDGNGIAFLGDGTPGAQDAIRAKVGTVAGRGGASPWSDYEAVAAGATLTVAVIHQRAIHSDYRDPEGNLSELAGNALADFTPTEMAVYIQRQSTGTIYEYLLGVIDDDPQEVLIGNLSDGAIIGAVPVPVDGFSLFTPDSGTFTSEAGSSDFPADNYRVAIAYNYDGTQATSIQLQPLTGDNPEDWLYVWQS